MKKSKYSIFLESKGGFWAINTLSRTVVKISKKIYDQFQCLPSILEPIEIIDVFGKSLSTILFYSGFFVKHDFNEDDRLEECINSEILNTDIFGIVISPTLECNASCHYCFENKVRHNDNLYDIEKIKSIILKNILSAKLLTLQWFGGEPLLKKDFVLRMSENIKLLCKTKSIDYTASIVTNGFLLTSELAHDLSRVGVRQAQITLEGDKLFHDKVRHLKDGNGTFDKIIENIISIGSLMSISVRVHVVPYNIKSVLSLLEYLGQRSVGTYIKEIYFSPLFNYRTCSTNVNFVHDDKKHFTVESFAKIEPLFYQCAKKNNLPLPDLFNVSFDVCTAVRAHSVMIDYNGNLKKCYFELGNNSEFIGKLSNAPNDLSTHTQRNIFVLPKNKDCETCNILPICFGGCPKMAGQNTSIDNACNTARYNLSEMLNIFYSHRG